jgi:hypothetical protein
LFQDYGDKLEEPPAKKKKRDGPVRISIPTLKDLHKNLEEEGQSRELDTEKNPPRLEKNLIFMEQFISFSLSPLGSEVFRKNKKNTKSVSSPAQSLIFPPTVCI